MQEQHALPIPTATTYAAIDIGSNTLRVVVAQCTLGSLQILATDEQLLRIGESVNATGDISAQKCDEAISTLRTYKVLAERYSAHSIFAVATEAIRKASNKHEFLAAIKRETGIEAQLIEGDVEATLTFYGATYAIQQQANPPEAVAVMDIGGGSTELIVAKDMLIRWHTSLALGSGQVHDRYLLADPPSLSDIQAARTFLASALEDLYEKKFPSVLLATGGTANVLLLLAQRVFGLDESQDYLTYADLLRCEGLLCALPAQELAQRYQLDAKRVRILTAGTLIVLAIIEQFQLDRIIISTYGIREGILLASMQYGEQWLEQVKQRTAEVALKNVSNAMMSSIQETFADAGRRTIIERAEKMFEWLDDVIKNKDVEAVHKMRVASRRLRATLDAYEAVCDPKLFTKVYRKIKKMADILGLARDADVMIERLQSQLKQAVEEEEAGLRWLIEQVRGYRREHQQALEEFLQDLDDKALMRQIEQCIAKGEISSGKV